MTDKKPVFGTREWANETADCDEGCSHDCHYCYAKGEAIRFKRKTAENWHIQRPTWGKMRKVCRMSPCKVMFPAHHDITPGNLGACMSAIEQLLSVRHKLLIVSKPHVQCIATIVDDFAAQKDKILFRFTIGSQDTDTLKFWEPFAPTFCERFLALQYAHLKGYGTGVSCEPMLDANVRPLVKIISPYITDSIWLGLPNHLQQRLSINGAPAEVKRRGEELLKALNHDYIMDLYCTYKDNPMIRWKESIKKVVGIEVPTKTGLDI